MTPTEHVTVQEGRDAARAGRYARECPYTGDPMTLWLAGFYIETLCELRRQTCPPYPLAHEADSPGLHPRRP